MYWDDTQASNECKRLHFTVLIYFTLLVRYLSVKNRHVLMTSHSHSFKTLLKKLIPTLYHDNSKS